MNKIFLTKKTKSEFLFTKHNYTILLVGIVVIAFGFLCMIGESSQDTTQFDESIFSFRRIHLSSALVLFGMGISFYSIFKKDKTNHKQ